MEWNSEEKEKKNKGISSSTKLLIGMIACFIVIIVLLILIIAIKNEKSEPIISYLYVDGENVNTVNKETLLKTIDEETYISIEEFAKVVGYEYHKGEYKSSNIEENKCYVEGNQETTTFYLNDNNIYKLPINKADEEYRKILTEKDIIIQDGMFYASFETISKAFNVFLEKTSDNLKVYTLDYLVASYELKVQEWGYTGIADQSFENRKALLYGYLIVKKDGGLYKIINLDNTQEFVLDRYISIEFSEHMQEFFVTNPSEKVGIVNIVNETGNIKIEPQYESIEVLDQKEELYLIKQSEKYGVINNNGFAIIYPEYDAIGLTNNTTNLNNRYLILDTLIPVCKEQKWGACDKEGKMVLSLEYDEFGYNLTSIEIDGIKQSVQPVLIIDRCNGIVVRKEDKYGLVNVSGEELVPIKVNGIYAINGVKDENLKYFMLYKGKELNVIERLIIAGLIKENEEDDDSIIIEITNSINKDNNLVTNNITTNNSVNN